ncbi:MAG TPA: DUF222 domain-containing protein [Acidimicrobiia bacterium]|nr:DUF222 domain-containing protein [Acidimicrobiia bacterium]
MERERFTNDQVEQVLSQLFSGLAVFHAQICDWLIEADVSQQFLVDGPRDLAQWVSARFDLRHSTAGQLVRVSRRLRDLPLLRERFAAGEMSLDQVDAISKLATPSTEEALIAECAGLSNAALDRAARRSRPPSTEDALDAFRERWFSIQYTLDGIRGHMDAVVECVVTDHRRVLGIGRRLPPHTGLAAASTLVPGWRLPGPRLSGETLRSRSPSPTLVPGRAHPSGQSDLVVWLPPPVRPRAWVEDRDRPRWASSVPETRR